MVVLYEGYRKKVVNQLLLRGEFFSEKYILRKSMLYVGSLVQNFTVSNEQAESRMESS